MFKKIVSDTLGLSDIGKIIMKEDFDKTDIDDYIFHEDNEKIYFVIKSKKDEYCFTNKAFLHLDGDSAVSSKRMLKRYEYLYHTFDEVTLQTAGTIDLDVEIMFKVNDTAFSIDVERKQIELLKDLYKSLVTIANLQEENKINLQFAHKSQEISSGFVRDLRNSEGEVSRTHDDIRTSVQTFLQESHKEFNQVDFGDVFEKYLNN